MLGGAVAAVAAVQNKNQTWACLGIRLVLLGRFLCMRGEVGAEGGGSRNRFCSMDLGLPSLDDQLGNQFGNSVGA